MQIHASSRPAGDTTADAHHWSVEATSYDAGMAEIQLALPEGWKLLHVRVDD